jgi:hypothetical protein
MVKVTSPRTQVEHWQAEAAALRGKVTDLEGKCAAEESRGKKAVADLATRLTAEVRACCWNSAVFRC